MPFVDWRIRAPLGTPLGRDPYRPVREGSSHGHTVSYTSRTQAGWLSDTPSPLLTSSTRAQLTSSLLPLPPLALRSAGELLPHSSSKRTKRNWSIGVAKCQEETSSCA